MKKNDKKVVLFNNATQNNDSTNKATENDSLTEIPEYNDYYLTVSVRFRTAKIVCVFALCIFILSSMLIFGESMTYENARYIMRDLGQILSEDSSEPAPQITFDVDGEMDYTVFRGSIVVCGVSGVDIFSPSGNIKLSDNTSFISPCAVASNKYCIVYSLGAYNLSVYNTVARVYDMKFDYPIYDVAVSDDGYIAVMTQSNEYKCVVYMYNSDFKLVGSYNKTNYPCAVEINDQTNTLYIATFGTKSGQYNTKIDSYSLNKEAPDYSVEIQGGLPYDIAPMTDGSIALLSANQLYSISTDGGIRRAVQIDGEIADYHFTDTNITLLINNKSISLRSFDHECNSLCTYDADGAVDAFYAQSSYMIRDKSTVKVITDSENAEPKLIEVDHGVKKMISNDGYLFVCYPDRINSIRLK